ncbi:MAG: immunoglobulin [Anaeromassilibacillus sp.]
MELSRYEQETIILYNQAEKTASVYTHAPKLLEKLDRLAEVYPQQITPDGPNTYLVPKGCVLIREPYSEKRRAAARERAKAAGIRPPMRGAGSKTE